MGFLNNYHIKILSLRISRVKQFSHIFFSSHIGEEIWKEVEPMLSVNKK